MVSVARWQPIFHIEASSRYARGHQVSFDQGFGLSMQGSHQPKASAWVTMPHHCHPALSVTLMLCTLRSFYTQGSGSSRPPHTNTMLLCMKNGGSPPGRPPCLHRKVTMTSSILARNDTKAQYPNLSKISSSKDYISYEWTIVSILALDVSWMSWENGWSVKTLALASIGLWVLQHAQASEATSNI